VAAVTALRLASSWHLIAGAEQCWETLCQQQSFFFVGFNMLRLEIHHIWAMQLKRTQAYHITRLITHKLVSCHLEFVADGRI